MSHYAREEVSCIDASLRSATLEAASWRCAVRATVEDESREVGSKCCSCEQVSPFVTSIIITPDNLADNLCMTLHFEGVEGAGR